MRWARASSPQSHSSGSTHGAAQDHRCRLARRPARCHGRSLPRPSSPRLRCRVFARPCREFSGNVVRSRTSRAVTISPAGWQAFRALGIAPKDRAWLGRTQGESHRHRLVATSPSHPTPGRCPTGARSVVLTPTRTGRAARPRAEAPRRRQATPSSCDGRLSRLQPRARSLAQMQTRP